MTRTNLSVTERLQRAVNLLSEWNHKNPKREVPFEWVEELVYAYAHYQVISPAQIELLQDMFYRYQEFSNRIPDGLKMMLLVDEVIS